MIRAIIFDCFGVLTTDTWRAFIDGLPPGTDREAAHDLNRVYNAGLIDRATFVAGIEQATGRRPQDIEKLLGHEITKNTVLLDYIRTLKDKYAIGMISNIASNWIRDTLLTAEEQGLFDQMIFSFEVGMTKPDPRIFMLACERLRVGPHEAVMIDDIDRYVLAAEREGLKGIVYEDFQQMKWQLELLLSD